MKESEGTDYELPDLNEDDRALFQELPADGAPASQRFLRQNLGWDDLRFWRARDSLIEKGYITAMQAKGGNFYRRLTLEEVPELAPEPDEDGTRITDLGPMLSERQALSPSSPLFGHFACGIEKWVLESGYGNYFVEAPSGSGQSRSAHWGKSPDVVFVAVETFQYVPNKHLEVFSFDVKAKDDWSLESVYQAAGHTRYSQRVYLALQKDLRQGPPAGLEARIEEECRRLGVGLIIFEEAGDYSTFRFKLHAPTHACSPREMDRLLDDISPENKAKILRWLR